MNHPSPLVQSMCTVGRVYRIEGKCEDCGGHCEIELDTDGMGHVLERLLPCRACEARRRAPLRAMLLRREGHRVLAPPGSRYTGCDGELTEFVPGVCAMRYGRTWFAPRGAGGMSSKGGKLERLALELLAGKGMLQASIAVGSSKATARKLKDHLESLVGPIRCRCGELSGHRGWCPVRYAASPARQAVVRRFRWVE